MPTYFNDPNQMAAIIGIGRTPLPFDGSSPSPFAKEVKVVGRYFVVGPGGQLLVFREDEQEAYMHDYTRPPPQWGPDYNEPARGEAYFHGRLDDRELTAAQRLAIAVPQGDEGSAGPLADLVLEEYAASAAPAGGA